MKNLALLRLAIRWGPVSRAQRLAWRRELTDRAFNAELDAARQDPQRGRPIHDQRRFGLQLLRGGGGGRRSHSHLMAQARRLRVPIAHRYDTEGGESEAWYRADRVGQWNLTRQGIAQLRSEIRAEPKARREAGPQWSFWSSLAIGLSGSTTGLLAVILRK